MIKVIRLNNGEHVICDLTNGNKSTYIVKHGFTLYPDQDNPKQVKFYSFAPYSTQGGVLELSKDSVSFVSEPAVEIIDSYNSILNGTLAPVHE